MRLLLAAALALVLASTASAQSRAAAPVDVALLADAAHPFQYRVSVVARVDADIVADVRFVHLDVRPAGSRRALGCDAPARPRHPESRHLSPGQTWSESFDVRTICWGRALDALRAGAELGGSLGTTRTHTGARATPGTTFRPAPIPFSPALASALRPAPTGDVSVTLTDVDATSGARIALRVRVRSTRAIRAWVQPDRFRFRVVSPDGTTHTCAMTRNDGSPIPDLFARVSARSGPMRSLDARAYCPEHTFDHAGIYEITPLLDLDVDGRRWRMDTPMGTFEGTPAWVRVRTSTGGDV